MEILRVKKLIKSSQVSWNFNFHHTIQIKGHSHTKPPKSYFRYNEHRLKYVNDSGLK
jgi:hypothetical protein